MATMLRRALWAAWRATPFYYFLRRILVPLFAHAYFGTPYFPKAFMNCLLFVVLGGLVVASVVGAQESSLAAQERRMDRMNGRILQNQKEIAKLNEHLALLPFLANEQEEMNKEMKQGFSTQAKWNERSLMGIVALLLVIVGFFVKPYLHHRKPGAPHPAKT